MNDDYNRRRSYQMICTTCGANTGPHGKASTAPNYARSHTARSLDDSYDNRRHRVLIVYLEQGVKEFHR